jgi:tRNA modification GTPase
MGRHAERDGYVEEHVTLALDETICAIATAAGGALRGVVRISGSDARDVVGRLGQFTPPLDSVRRPAILQGTIELPQDIGPAPVTLYWWPTSKSYTREPCAELHLPGSPPLLAAALEAACAAGARLARPGEFTLRAFLAGRLDLTQAEAVLGVIDADSWRQLESALAQLAGGLAQPLAALRERLLDLLAHLEAGLDFVEEDIEFISRPELLRELEAIRRELALVTAQLDSRGDTNERPRIVLYGLPNAGKSSLLNALAGADAAIVSETAGTTRDFVTRVVKMNHRECLLIDTAGLTSPSVLDPLHLAAQDAAASELATADVKLLCVDRSKPLSAWETEQRSAADPRRLLIWTKCDLPPAEASLGGGIATSSRSGLGLVELRRAIEQALEPGEAGAVAATADRCRESLRLAEHALSSAAAAALQESAEELVAAEVRVALDELGRVVGAVYTEDLLDRVFSRFCIGK